jgi:hypothetical protein
VSFEEESKVLLELYNQKFDENSKARREADLRGELRGLDSRFDLISQKCTYEFKRELVLLKVKYGIELNDWERKFYDHIKDQPLESE